MNNSTTPSQRNDRSDADMIVRLTEQIQTMEVRMREHLKTQFDQQLEQQCVTIQTDFQLQLNAASAGFHAKQQQYQHEVNLANQVGDRLRSEVKEAKESKQVIDAKVGTLDNKVVVR